MPKIEIKICEFCKAEQRSDKPNQRWDDGFESITLDFKNEPRIQSKLEYSVVCPACARALFDVVCAKIKEITHE